MMEKIPLSCCVERKGCHHFRNLPPRFQFDKLIGIGAYGAVCQAVDLKKGTIVAVKRISNIFKSEVSARRVLREVYIMSRLKCDQIVAVFKIMEPTNCDNFDVCG